MKTTNLKKEDQLKLAETYLMTLIDSIEEEIKPEDNIWLYSYTISRNEDITNIISYLSINNYTSQFLKDVVLIYNYGTQMNLIES